MRQPLLRPTKNAEPESLLRELAMLEVKGRLGPSRRVGDWVQAAA